MLLEDLEKKCFLFFGTDKKTLALANEKGVIKSLIKGEKADHCGRLSLVLSGRLNVYENKNGSSALLNTLKTGDVFGFASLFGGVCEQTEIKAAESCTLAVFDQQTVEQLMKNDFVFTKNYISLLTGKIRFLNRRISDFTANNAEKKLAGYLLMRLANENQEDSTLTVSLSMVKLASSLDMGRASLYRAFESLERKNAVKRSKGTVTVLSTEILKKITEDQL